MRVIAAAALFVAACLVSSASLAGGSSQTPYRVAWFQARTIFHSGLVGDHTIAILKRCTTSSATTLAAALLHRTSDYRLTWGTTTFEAKVCVALVPAKANTCDPWFLAAAGDLFCTEDIANKVRLVTDAELSRAYRLAFDDRGA